MIRLGLCCKFHREPIRFRTATATHLKGMDRCAQMEKLSKLCLANASSLLEAVEYCGANRIGCFRVNSQILPLKTHPDVGYAMGDLPGWQEIRDLFLKCRDAAEKRDVRLTFHPDQFILLSAVRADIVEKSIEELEYQAEVSDMIGADVINIHAGGAYGDKDAALERMRPVVSGLKERVRTRLTIENDDRLYSPADLLPFCRDLGVPLVYDVHHHRCLQDGLSIEEATRLALSTWNREPLFHVSSPKGGWEGPNRRWHADYIDPADFPAEWRSLDVTVEVEAKAKELAVKKLCDLTECMGKRLFI